MRECPHCGRRASALDRFCSTCSTPLGEDVSAERDAVDDVFDAPFDFDEARLTPIARFLNAAEAGYFAHELKLAERVPAFITAEESFDAVAGYWTTRFLLCVPHAAAVRAAEVLQQLVEDSDGDELAAPRNPGRYDVSHASADPDSGHGAASPIAEAPQPAGVGWVPLVLTLAAGSAAFWGVRRLDEPPRRPAAPIKRPDAEQWDRLPGPARPWTIPHENGHGQRQFWLETDRNRAVVREDADGDGLYEVEQQHELPAR